jgi:predicted GIY-YIG superfamily endonuclease
LKDIRSKLAKTGEWSIYFLRCSDGSIYTGIAKDVQRRLHQHQHGRGAKYTASRLPVILEASRSVGTQSEALKLEYAVKRLSRDNKLQLIRHIVTM